MKWGFAIAAVCVAQFAHAEMIYRGQIDPAVYSEEVAVFTSPGFERGKPYELLLHLHGFRSFRQKLGRVETFDDILNDMNFDAMLAGSGRAQTVLVVPSSAGKCETYARYFSSNVGFSAFIGEMNSRLSEMLGANPPDKFSISGHSGAYKAIADIITHSDVMITGRVLLLDATYGRADAYAGFLKRHPEIRFESVFLGATKTEDGAKAIYDLGGSNVSFENIVLDGDAADLDGKLKSQNVSFVRWMSDDEDGHWNLAKKFFR